MAIPHRLIHAASNAGADPWEGVASIVTQWAHVGGFVLRDAIVLVPFAQLLAPARRAFACGAAWMPRIETVQTLAASLGPAAAWQAGQISFDATADALSAVALLRSQAWGAAWSRRDRRGFDQAAQALVATAQALARAAFALPPGERMAYWAKARDMQVPVSGPGATERLLTRVAVEWACLAPAPASDRLFALATPAAWIVVQAGGPDPLVARVTGGSKAACLWIDTDAPADEPFSGLDASVAPAFALCDGFEHEAQCATAQVLEHIRRDEVPVALIAQDRLLMRRIRALLERDHVRVLDETGWKLSTTRAAAQVMTLLRAVGADATTDAVIDWLKSGAARANADDAGAIASFEAHCRRHQIARASALPAATLDAPAARLWAHASATLQELSGARSPGLSGWLTALSMALDRCGAMQALLDDDAGRQVIAALRLAPAGFASDAWVHAAGSAGMPIDEFRAWVDEVLERATYVPASTFEEPAQVIVTPLARAMLRPFGAVVFPGADDKHLGAEPASLSLLRDAQAGELGVPTSMQRRSAELLAFVQLLAAPRITFMRRRVDAGEPLADSALIERLALALAARGRSLAPWHDPRVECQLLPTPIRMSAPHAPALLPQRLSASACETLRACPYRFFALNMLRLREDDELDREADKRDYGNWLHAVLYEFHLRRQAPAAAEAEIARLESHGAAMQVRSGVDAAGFLPFAASFAAFAPRYIAWLHERDAAGARWRGGEEDLGIQPDELGGTELRGIIDRIDETAPDGGVAIELIDYKTGGATELREKVKRPLEDTQLAFYAALMRKRTDAPLKATYLALDRRDAIEEIEHPGVASSAAALLDGLAHDLVRLRAGAGMPALGVGAACEHCAARGICRRDHWTDDAAPQASDGRSAQQGVA